jgi:K+-sensing histidine kinase KdpD
MAHFLSLNLNDFTKGLIVAVFSAVLGFCYQFIQNNGLSFTSTDLKEVLTIAILSAMSYLIKNLFTNNKGEFGRADK